jgi:hypothetical protein
VISRDYTSIDSEIFDPGWKVLVSSSQENRVLLEDSAEIKYCENGGTDYKRAAEKHEYPLPDPWALFLGPKY